MAGFDPDAYIAATDPTPPPSTDFNPDEYLKATEPKQATEVAPPVLQPSRFPSAYIPPDVEKEVSQKFDVAHPGIAATAAGALIDTAVGMIPKSLKEIAGFATPVVSAVEDVGKAGQSLSDVLFGGKTPTEAAATNYPESLTLQEAEKTPPFSPERFRAGFQTLADVGMGSAIAAGLMKPSLSETLGYSTSEVDPLVAAVNESLAKQPTTEGVPNASEIQSTTAPDGGLRARSELGQLPAGNVPPTDARLRSDLGEEAAQTRQGPQAQPQAQEVAPRLLPGETQGDLISSTQQEPFALAGEKISPEEPPKPTEPQPSEAYLAASEKANAASREFRPIQEQYQAGKISDQEFLAAKAKHDAAQAEFDKAFAAEQSGKEQTDMFASDWTEATKPAPETENLLSEKEQEAKLKAEYEAGLLEDVEQHQQRGGPELLDAVKSLGGLRIDEPHFADLKEAFQKKSGFSKLASGEEGYRYKDIFRKNAAGGDALVQALRARGFDIETPGQLADILDRRFKTGKKIYGSEARAEQGGISGLRPSTEGGFLGSTSGTFKSIAIKVRRALDAATGRRSERLQKSFADAQRAAKEIRKVAPTDRRQNAISVWMEAGGDMATIDQWAAQAKGKMFKRAAEDAKTLTPEEIAIAQKARAAFDVLSQRGKNYDILGAHRDNYVPHVWDVSQRFTGIGSSKLQDRFKFNKARTFDNFFEGDQAGFVPKTMAIGKVLPAYMTEMNKVIADRQFVQDVANKTASDGRPLVVPRGNAKTVDTTDYVVRNGDGSPLPRFQKAVYDTKADAQAALKPGQTIEERPSTAALVNPKGFAKAEDAQGNPIDTRDYKVVDQPALNNWRWVETDPQGNATILKSDLAVHPDLAKRLNAMTGQSAIRQWYNEPSKGLAVIPKAIVKGLDVGQSVMKREMFGLLAPFHQVQEGTHAIGHTINPFSNIPNVERPTPEMADAMRYTMILPERTPAGHYMEGLGGRGSFLSQAGRFLGEKAGDSIVGKAARGMSDTIDGYQDFLFHKYIPGLKFKTYQHILERNLARYADDLKQGHVTVEDVKALSGAQTDAAYGHLNYAQLDRNPTMQHIMQLTMLAPDFLEARTRFAGQALKTLAGEKAGAEQFRAIAVLAATQAGVMYTLSKTLGGEWDAKHPFEMTLNGRRYMLRSVPEDMHRLFAQGPDIRREFVSARVNPALQKLDQLRTGLNYRGEKTAATDTMTELLANYIPITARSIPGLRGLTETGRNNPVSPLEQLAGSLGLKISRYSPITKTHQLASQWMDKQGIAKDRGSYPISKFQQLRYALEDGDLNRAKVEWDKLSKGADQAKLAKGFQQSINHPFTGSTKNDVEFAKSLSESDKAIFDHAKEVRKGIMDKFHSIYAGPTGKPSGRMVGAGPAY